MRPVFLSASIPDPRRHPRYIDTADEIAIRESVSALATVVLHHTTLVFGGHPAISPLVRLIAHGLDAMDKVRIFQSRFFESVVPRDSREFTDLVWTPAVSNDRDASLRLMRDLMLNEGPFEAAFFIGGMEGVEDEFDLFSRRWTGTPAFPIASTGAAARILFDRYRDNILPYLSRGWENRLREEFVYRPFFEELLHL
ncbi:MAG: hypothetical protein Q7W02_14945 [Candidatus Rokubacteria bacterium]|nr:hypothetical protein [Candidatus Rokubacteria bacterium]